MALIGKRIVISGADFTDVRLDTEIYNLTSISVTTQPNKTVYGVGETFDPAGMVITATLTGTISGNIKNNIVTQYTFSPTSAFDSTGSKTITISYSKGGVTKTTTLTVSAVDDIPVYSVTKNVVNGTLSGPSSIQAGSSITLTISPSTGYVKPVGVEAFTITGANIISYDEDAGTVTINNATGNVTISVICPEEDNDVSWKTIPIQLGNNLTAGQFRGQVNRGTTKTFFYLNVGDTVTVLPAYATASHGPKTTNVSNDIYEATVASAVYVPDTNLFPSVSWNTVKTATVTQPGWYAMTFKREDGTDFQVGTGQRDSVLENLITITRA